MRQRSLFNGISRRTLWTPASSQERSLERSAVPHRTSFTHPLTPRTAESLHSNEYLCFGMKEEAGAPALKPTQTLAEHQRAELESSGSLSSPDLLCLLNRSPCAPLLCKPSTSTSPSKFPSVPSPRWHQRLDFTLDRFLPLAAAALDDAILPRNPGAIRINVVFMSLPTRVLSRRDQSDISNHSFTSASPQTSKVFLLSYAAA